MRSSDPSHLRKAFTLVELLVVIGIIAVLISILLPTIGRAKEHANRIKCAANLRSLGQALTLYTQQWRYYPGDSTPFPDEHYAIWPTRLRPYVGGNHDVFHCPSRPERFRWRKTVGGTGGPRAVAVHLGFGYEEGELLLAIYRSPTPFSYGYNLWGTVGQQGHRGLGGSIATDAHLRSLGAREVPVGQVKAAEDMIAIADSTGDRTCDFWICPQPRDVTCLPGDVHRGGANVLFCDGHVQWYLQKDLRVSDDSYEPQEAATRRMWNRDHLP